MQPYHSQQQGAAYQPAVHTMYYPQGVAVPYPPPPQTAPSHHTLLQAIDRMLTMQQQNLMTRMDDFQGSVNRLAGMITTGRQDSREQLTGLDNVFQDAHRKQIMGMQIMIKKILRLEAMLGTPPPDSDSCVSIMDRVSSIEKDVQELVGGVRNPEAGQHMPDSITRRETGTSPHLPSIDLPEKEYSDVAVVASIPPLPPPVKVSRSTNTLPNPERTYRDVRIGSLPSPVFVSRSTCMRREQDKTYCDASVEIRPSSDMTSSHDGSSQKDSDESLSSNTGFPLQLFTSSAARNHDGGDHMWGSVDAPFVHHASFTPRFGTSDMVVQALVPATWARPQDDSSSYTYSTNPSIRDEFSPDDFSPDPICSTIRAIMSQGLLSNQPSQPVHPVEDAENQPPSISTTQEPSPDPPGVDKVPVPSNEIQDYHQSGAAIDTSLIFAPFNARNEPLKPAATPKASDLQLDLDFLSPLTSINDTDNDEVQLSRETVSVNPLKRKKSPSNYNSTSAPPSKKNRRKSALPRRKPDDDDDGENDVVWPEIVSGDVGFQKQFIQCDICLSWYHYVCVGIVEHDPRLESDSTFKCQRCEQTSHKRTILKVGNDQQDPCARPNCDQLGTNEYFVEKLLGRRLKNSTEYEWLVKYDGYPVKDSTWEVNENIGAYEHHIEEFMVAARDEGLDVDQHENMVLLAKAADFAFLWK